MKKCYVEVLPGGKLSGTELAVGTHYRPTEAAAKWYGDEVLAKKAAA